MLQYKPILNRLLTAHPYEVNVLRLDAIHPEISGNKWFKLKYNLQKAVRQGHNKILTFGGAYSNHIAATAACARDAGLKAVGIIRGEDTVAGNPTLQKAIADGMELHFVSRELYKQKDTSAFVNSLTEKFGSHFLVPEGGSNSEGALGCAEILAHTNEYDYVLCACGTGTTYAGLLVSAGGANVVGISVLKGENRLPEEAAKLATSISETPQVVAGNEALDTACITKNLITNRYCFSGYAACDTELVVFKKEFESQHGIALDYVYTNKLFYAAFDLMAKERFKKGSRLLLVHSGGLQGNAGFEERYHLKLTL